MASNKDYIVETINDVLFDNHCKQVEIIKQNKNNIVLFPRVLEHKLKDYIKKTDYVNDGFVFHICVANGDFPDEILHIEEEKFTKKDFIKSVNLYNNVYEWYLTLTKRKEEIL